MQEKLRNLLSGLSVGSIFTNALWVIYFITFYGLVLHLVSQKLPIMNWLSNIFDMASNIATVVGVYIAFRAARIWKRQAKATILMELLRDFRKVHVELELFFIKMRDDVAVIEIVHHWASSNPDNEVSQLIQLRKQTADSLSEQYKRLALVLDHTFNGRIVYDDITSLGFFSENLINKIDSYFHGLKSNDPVSKKLRAAREKEVFALFDEVTKQLPVLEERI